MSEMTRIEQQQQFVGSSTSDHHCKDHRVSFESEKSLEVHLRYHNENLLSQWASQAQQEESNNNNSKAGNHNSSNHMGIKRDSVTAPADSSEPSSRPPSEGLAASSSQTSQEYPNFQSSMFNEALFMQNEANYILPHNYSPNGEDNQNGAGNYIRYHPYQHQQRFPQGDRSNSVSSSSPRSPLQCDKCGAVYEDPNLLAEHLRSSHHTSPNSYHSQPQYQQLGTSPQHQIQRHQQSQMHTSPPLNSQQQQGFDFSGGTIIKSEMKQEAEDQAEILDLDSHKVQTHRYEEDMMRVQQHQEIQMQLHHHAMHHQRNPAHSVSSMLGWHTPQLHDYHTGVSPMGLMESASPMPDQGQFLRGQQMPLEPVRHDSTPVITSTQSLSTHQIAPVLHQQSQKSPLANQSWKSNEARRPKTYNCTACNKWFTSSGHLKRHYNTTLHKNAVKVSNQPDPANMPISVHHHPGRDAVGTRGGQRSPEQSSSRSPPNMMAGPSGEAMRGLQHTPTSNSNSSNSSESSAVQGILSQQQVPSAVHMSNHGPHNCPPQSLMGHQQLPMGTLPHHLAQHNHQMSSPHMPVHRPMNSTITSIQHPTTHLNTPSPMDQHHHMGSTSPMMGGVPSMVSPPPPMGGTTMPHQPYPNDMPPHVTTITSTQGLMDITSLTTTGNDLPSMPFTQEILSSFGAFNSNQRPLPSFTNFGMNSGFTLVGQNQPMAVNVGGLSPEENIPPPDSCFNTPMCYDTYRHSPPKYESLTNLDIVQCTNPDDNIFLKYADFSEPNHLTYEFSRSLCHIENKNRSNELPKEELNPNIKRRKNAKVKVIKTKELQVTSHAEVSSITPDLRHKCHDCNKYFNKACYLTQHNKSFHAGDKPFKCNQCGKRFPYEHLHAEHLQKHAGEKPYKCEICPKQFNHKTDLRRHMCLHTGEKPYACDICQKGFIRKDHMMKHVETHKKKQSVGQANVHFRA